MLWKEQRNLQVQKGFINIYLGIINPIGLSFDIPYWLEISIDAANPYARIRLSTVPYAYYAVNADSSKYSSVSKSANTVKDGAITLAKLAPAKTVGDLHWDGTKWILSSDSPPTPGAFETSRGVTSNKNGVLSSDDFVFGSDQLDDDKDAEHDYRFFFDKSKGAFRAGKAGATEWDETKRGISSFASGMNNIASGPTSTAMGYQNTASGNISTAMGTQNLASGVVSTVMGGNNIAYGNYSTVLGLGNNAYSFCQTNIGRYSVITNGDPERWLPLDRLFVIGNGISSGARSDALIVLKNGNTRIN